MDADSPPVFVLTIEAVAGPENSVPDGKRYALLVFVRGATEEAAQMAGLNGIAELGWIEPALLRTGEITDPSGVPDDLKRAFANAQAHGCAIIVYDDP
jgi:hypothetical protein